MPPFHGRRYHGWPASPLANHIRTADLEEYRDWLLKKIRSQDPAVCAALARITEETILGCWCRPAGCHCDIIWEVWQEGFALRCPRCRKKQTVRPWLGLVHTCTRYAATYDYEV